MNEFDAALFVLAVVRLVRLVSRDEVPFGWAVERLTPGKFLERLVSCPFCLSMWVGFGWYAAWLAYAPGWRVLSVVLAASLVAGLILVPFHAWEDRAP